MPFYFPQGGERLNQLPLFGRLSMPIRCTYLLPPEFSISRNLPCLLTLYLHYLLENDNCTIFSNIGFHIGHIISKHALIKFYYFIYPTVTCMLNLKLVSKPFSVVSLQTLSITRRLKNYIVFTQHDDMYYI